MELHRHHSVEKLRRIAQELYSDKKYSDALIAFTAAIKASNGNDLRLYDNRAATHEKLEDLQSALRDGYIMLREDKTFLRGYLRTAKVLQTMELSATALKIYERGLKYVPVKTEHYGLMQQQHDKLARSLCPPTAVDPFTVLPIELIDMTLRYLTFPQKCQLLRVSKSWKRLLTTWPLIWRDLDFAASTNDRPVRVKAIFDYMARAEYGVTRFTLDGLDLQSSKLLAELTSRCKDLTTLKLYNRNHLRQSLLDATQRAQNLKHLVLGISVSIELRTVTMILKTCALLVTAYFGRIDEGEIPSQIDWGDSYAANLEQFTVRMERFNKSGTGKLLLDAICPPSTKLKKIGVYGPPAALLHLLTRDFARYRPQLEEVILQHFLVRTMRDEGGERDLYSLPPNTRQLKLIRTSSFGSGIWSGPLDTSADYPSLCDIEIREWSIHAINLEMFQELLHCNGPSTKHRLIEKLDLAMEHIYTRGDLEALIGLKRLAGLRHVRLRFCESFDDALAAIVAGSWKELRSISIPACKMTGVGLKALVTELPHLGQADFTHCSHLSGDAIGWARAKGVKMIRETWDD